MNLDTLLTVSDIEEAARAVLDHAVWTYVAGGAGTERTVHGNVAAFNAVWLRPRIRGTSCAAPETSVALFGYRLSMPVLLAPTSPQRLLHKEAELATARAAATMGTISIVSTDSHYAFPAIAKTAAKNCWFQLYAYRSRSDVEATIDMAMEAGAEALVVTVDAYYPARRIAAKKAGFRTPPDVDFGTLRGLGILAGNVPADARMDRLPLTWDDLVWIRRRVKVPLFIKGILDPEDARRCVEIGADGVIVSNHGGRQLDGVVPTLVALERVAPAVRSDCIVLVDGGIRSGSDVIKALALGAHAVCIGRPYLWGLAIGGQSGVEAVLNLLRREIEDTLLQLGLSTICEVDRDCIADIRWPLPTATDRQAVPWSTSQAR
jgi:4-hydroxymandelate oxidase